MISSEQRGNSRLQVTTQVQGFTVQGFRLRPMREMKIKRFEDIEVWQLARELTRKVYFLTKKAGFAKDYGLKRQIQDASGS